MNTIKNYTKMYIGANNSEPIYLSPPSWDCGWYWGFGYLGNRDCHYHFDGLDKSVDFHTAIINHFEDLQIRPSNTWKFAELMKSFYMLKNTAELLGRGSAHLTSNPCKDIILNIDEVERINKNVLPSIFDEIYKILDSNKNNKKLFNRLVEIDAKGGTTKTLSFMNKNNIKPEDLKTFEDNKDYNHKYIDGLNSDDFSRLHSGYWKEYHANK